MTKDHTNKCKRQNADKNMDNYPIQLDLIGINGKIGF